MPRSPENHCRLAAIFASIGIVVAVLAHELAHAYMANLCGIKVTSIGILPFGGYTSFERPLTEISPLSQIAISIAGPIANLLIGVVALIPVKLSKESVAENTIQYISVMNIKLGVWNIIPILPVLDGGWVVRGIGRYLFGESIIAFVLAIIIAALSLTLWWKYKKHFDNLLEKISKL